MPHNNDLNLWQIIKIIIIIKNVEKKPCGIVYTYKTTDDVVWFIIHYNILCLYCNES